MAISDPLIGDCVWVRLEGPIMTDINRRTGTIIEQYSELARIVRYIS
jgi:hypothetical protein